MTNGDMAYLTLVIVAFLIFVGTLAKVSFASQTAPVAPPELVRRHAEETPKRS